MVLTTPDNVQETIKQLEDEMCSTSIVNLARTQNWALKGYWPLVWQGRGVSAPVLSNYTAGTSSTKRLKALVRYVGIQRLPQNIIIKDRNNNFNTYLSSEYLTPPQEFQFTSHPQDGFIVVTPRPRNSPSSTAADVGPVTAPISSIFQDSDSDTDDEIIFGGSDFPSHPANISCNDDTLEDHNGNSLPNAENVSAPPGVDPGLDGLGKNNF